MLRVKFIAVAEAVYVDQLTNGIGLFNVLDVIAALGFPMILFRAALLLILEKDEADAPQQQIKISVTLDEMEIATQTGEAFFAESTRTRLIAQYRGLPVPHIGTLCFTVTSGNTELARYRIPIESLSTPQTVSAAGAPAAPGAVAAPDGSLGADVHSIPAS